MRKRIFLTGATGLLGSHVLEQGLSRGHHFTVLVRDISPRTYLHTVKDQVDKIRILTGDLLDSKNISIPTDIDTVIHAAGLASSRTEDATLMKAFNVEATKNLFEIFRETNVKWLQISSVATMCDGKSPIVDETLQGHTRRTPYAESKLEIDNWLEKQNSKILFLHPCYMLGKWDSKPSSGIVFFLVKMGKVPAFQNNIKNFVDAADVARGVWQALESHAVGHYLLGHHNLVIGDFLQKVAAEVGVPLNVEKTATRETEEFTREFCTAAAVNYTKAKKDFGYSPQIPLETSLKDAMDYFSRMKMLRKT